MRVVFAQVIPRSVQHVVISSPETPEGKLLLSLCRHVLDLQNLEAAPKIDVERLQISSQLICAVRCSLS